MRFLLLSLSALALVATGCTAARPAGGAGTLVGPTWQLATLGGDRPTGPDATLTFSSDGRVSGTTGCNRFTGTYELGAGGALSLSPLGTTRMACPPPAAEQERRVLDVLDAVERAEVEGGRLVLLGAGAALATFTAPPGAAGGAAQAGTVTGTVTYLPRIALPPDAVVTVRLLDVSRADAPSETLAEQTVQAEGRQVPVPFMLRYEPAEVDPRHRYVVRAEIRDGSGNLAWTTDTAYPVLNGAPTSGVEVRLVQVQRDGLGGGAGALVGPTWRLTEIDAASGLVVSLDAGAPYSLQFGADGRYSGEADCNRIGGEYDAGADGGLDLDRGLSTLAACPPGSASGDFLDVLAGVERYEVSGDRLTLGGRAGTLALVRDGSRAAGAAALVGPEWQLAQIRTAEGGAVAPQGDGGFTVAFLPDGRFTGQADCNRYGGTYTAEPGGDLVLSDAATTLAACAPPSSSREFFGVLNQAVGYSVAGGRLTLRGSDGGALVFEREGQGGMAPQETGRDYAYTCESADGPFTFRVRTGPGEIALWLPERFEGREGGTYRVLGQARSASGAKYEDGPVTVWTKGADYALLEVDGETFLDCTGARR